MKYTTAVTAFTRQYFKVLVMLSWGDELLEGPQVAGETEVTLTPKFKQKAAFALLAGSILPD